MTKTNSLATGRTYSVGNPLPHILDLIPLDSTFVKLDSYKEVVAKHTGKKPTDKAMWIILEGLRDSGYITLHKVNDDVTTIRKTLNGN